MKLAPCIAMAMLMVYAMASPIIVTASATLTVDQPGMPTSTSPSAMPASIPVETMPPAITPVNHPIVAEAKPRALRDPTVTGSPQTCELVTCTSTQFLKYSPVVTHGNCRSLENSMYCWPTSTMVTTCLDQNNLPECLYVRTVGHAFEQDISID